MANITKKASRLLAGLACTCPNSVLFALIEKFGFSEDFFDNLLKLEKFADLQKITTVRDEELQTFFILSHFVGERHFEETKSGMSIAREISVKVRPAMHQLLPLVGDDIYRNKEVKVKIENLIEMGNKSGKGFWAAHLCGKVWVSAKETSPGDIITKQAETPGFLNALSGVSSINVFEFRKLYENTFQAKTLLAKYL